VGKLSRSAFTLLELMVVLAVMGAIAASVTAFDARRVVVSMESRQQAQVLVSALRLARTTAIASGRSVRLTKLSRSVQHASYDGFGLAFDDTPDIPLQPDIFFPSSVKVGWSAAKLVFSPAGMSDRSLQIEVAGGNTHWLVEVLSASGQITSSKLKS
jgi:type II secretion system protein H